jgi:cyclopropane-fatty-acyl-phospholipid synthase
LSTTRTLEPGASAEAIRYHYDVNNEFFHRWLGETFTYSAALWEEGDSLESAQLRKMDYHARESRSGGARRVLDVGCGWGAMLRRLVDAHAVGHAIGLTLSQAQADWIESSRHPLIEARVENWSDHRPSAPYDAIISVGAFEHFARPELSGPQKIESYRAFFRRCHEWLKPEGWLSLQTIAYGNLSPAQRSEFIASAIFPESDLPTLAEVVLACEGYFEVVRVRNDRHDYEATNRAWLSRLKADRPELVRMVGEDVVARFQRFLSLFTIGFHTGTMSLLRITMRRNEPTRG